MKILYDYALSFLGVPYSWAGHSHFSVDCSGLVLELLESVGIAPPDDLSAQGLMKYFTEHGDQSNPRFGALAFYGRKNQMPAGEDIATHVGFIIDDKRMIEAQGGSAYIDSPQKAYEIGACVKMSMINRRKDLLVILRPRYELNGIV